MNPNWLGIISAILAVMVFLAAYRFAIKMPLKMRVIFLIIAVIAAIPGASFAFYYAHIFPEMSWYYELRSIAGTELLMVFVGVAGGLSATLLPRLLLVLPLLGAVALSVVPILKPLIRPLDQNELEDKWDGEVCLQSTGSTCGAASTATILKLLGIEATESEIAEEAHTYSGGTEAWYLARAARSRGCEVEFDLRSGFSPDGGLPAVVGVRLGSIGHFIPVLGREGERFIIGDPLRGREVLTLEELEKRYEFTGFHMRIKPNHP
jgi:hypothetical protein